MAHLGYPLSVNMAETEIAPTATAVEPVARFDPSRSLRGSRRDRTHEVGPRHRLGHDVRGRQHWKARLTRDLVTAGLETPGESPNEPQLVNQVVAWFSGVLTNVDHSRP